jgi:hypothetical protein
MQPTPNRKEDEKVSLKVWTPNVTGVFLGLAAAQRRYVSSCISVDEEHFSLGLLISLREHRKDH